MESIEDRLQEFSFVRNSIKDENRNSSNFYLFGVECNKGWHDLIYDLCEEIERVDNSTIIVQIKEKFGELRFYTFAHSDEVEEIIRKYEEKALTTCEACGKEGKIRTGGWIQVLCDEHYKK